MAPYRLDLICTVFEIDFKMATGKKRSEQVRVSKDQLRPEKERLKNGPFRLVKSGLKGPGADVLLVNQTTCILNSAF